MVKKNEHHLVSGCPIACSLDVLGDHWTLLIVRGLMFENRHEYKELLEMDEGIASNILTDRLKKLEKEKVISSAPHPESRRRKIYYLTAKGKDLIHVVLALIHWSAKYQRDRIRIPSEKKPFMDAPREQVIQWVLGNLEKWEKEFLTQHEKKVRGKPKSSG